MAYTKQNSLVFRDSCLKVVWNVLLVCIESFGIVNLLIVNVHFLIWNYWMNYVVYIGNSSYFFFFVIACSGKNNRLIFVFLFLFLTLVCIATTSFDKVELQCQKRLSQINVIVPIRLKFKLYALFIKWSNWIKFLFMYRTSSTVGTFPSWFLDTATKGWYRKLFDVINEKCSSKYFFATEWIV